MKFNICGLVLFLLVVTNSLTAVEMPTDGFLEGWQKEGPERKFTGQNLYGHINGGAELYIEFGFSELRVQAYKNNNARLTLELYRMENYTAALGIYLMNCGKELPSIKVNSRNTANPYQIIAIKGGYYVVVNNFSGDESWIPVMVRLVNLVLVQIDKMDFSSVVSLLPKEKVISGTEFIFRGPYALKPVFDFGRGDVFFLKGKIFGAGAQVKDAAGNIYTFLVIPYPSKKEAGEAYENVWTNLDSYHTKLDKSGSCFIFQDFQNKYALVKLENATLKIAIQMETRPKECEFL